MITSYLEELLNRCNSLKLVINPPHPRAFIQGRADQVRILLAELEKEVAEIEKQDAPTFELISLQGENGEWVGVEPSFYSQSQEWQQQDIEIDYGRITTLVEDVLNELRPSCQTLS